MLDSSTFQWTNSRGYDRARHAGKNGAASFLHKWILDCTLILCTGIKKKTLHVQTEDKERQNQILYRNPKKNLQAEDKERQNQI